MFLLLFLKIRGYDWKKTTFKLQCGKLWRYVGGGSKQKYHTIANISSQTFLGAKWGWRGPGSVVGIATGYGLDGPGIESRCGQDFLHLSRAALGPTQPPVQWVPGLSSWVKSGRRVTLTPHPLLVPWSRRVEPLPLLPLWAVRPVQSLSAYTRVHFTF